MRKKILCVSYLEDSAEFVEVERAPDGTFTLSPRTAGTNDSLQTACTRADEIYINGVFPSAQYEWETFPKVEPRYLHSLITGSIARKRPGSKASARFQYIRDTIREGKVSSLVAFQSIDKSEIASIFDLLSRFRKKVKHIYTLPAALAGAIVHAEKPSGNVLLLWGWESITVVAITAPDGMLKIARTLPYGLPVGEGSDVTHMAAANFSAEISREIMMTVSYFKQKFREPAPADIYLLGDDRLRTIFADFPLTGLDASLHFGLAAEILAGSRPEKLSSKVHLLGNLWANESFNFIPGKEIQGRKADRQLNAVLIGLLLLISLAGLWTLRIPAPQSHQHLIGQIRELSSDIRDLETSIAGLAPIAGRKKFYQSAFLENKPEFIGILEQITAVVPANMVFDSFSMNPADSFWNCIIIGKIKGRDWQERLDTLREFGRSLTTFDNIDIQNVTHSLGQSGMDETTISFQLSLQFWPGEDSR